MRKYSKQIFLNFQDPNSIDTIHGVVKLSNRLARKYETEIPVVQFDAEDLKDSLKELDEHSRLYIEAHGSSDESYRNKIIILDEATEDLMELTVQELANLLVKNLPQQVANGKPGLLSDRLMIGLHVCHAGKSYFESALNSFAAELQKQLAIQNIYVDINAYVSLYGVHPDGSSSYTIKAGEEEYIKKLLSELDKIRLEIDSETNPNKKQEMMSEAVNLHKKIMEQEIWQQPGSKLAFRWGTDIHDTPVQMAFDAYELKEHENCYYEIQNAIKELRDYANNKNQEGKLNYDDVISVAYTLADAIENEVKDYFNSIDKSEERTIAFKTNCQIHIDSANMVLQNNPDSIQTRILEKTTQTMSSLMAFSNHRAQPSLSKTYSQTLFSKKTIGKQITDHLSETLGETNNINPKP